MLARIALILAANDPNASWYAESAGFYGLVCDVFRFGTEIPLDDYDVLVFCGRGSTAPATRVEATLNRGGAILCCGDSWGLEHALGHRNEDGRHVGKGSLLPHRDERLWPAGAEAIRFFGGFLPSVFSASVLGTLKCGSPAITRNGNAWMMSPNLGRSMALMQLGCPVAGQSAGSESGDVEYWGEPLRAEQGSMLDLDHDREEGLFSRPHADALADVWIKMILTATEEIGLASALLWPWPGGANCAALVSAECDSPEPDDVYAMERVLRYTATPATLFCPPTLLPADVLRRFREDGAEIGILAEELDSPEHVAERLKVQCLSLMRLSGLHQILTLRPQDGRWQGLTTIYESADRAGVRAVAAKGPRQAGTSGFPFGTARPFWARGQDGSPLGVLEVPHSVFEPGLHAEEGAVEHIADAIARRHGCLHITMRASHMREPVHASALRTSILNAKAHHAAFLTMERLLSFERVRRKLRTRWTDQGFSLSSESLLPNLAVLTTGSELSGTGLKVLPQSVRRLGREFKLGVVSLDGVTNTRISANSGKLDRAA